MKFTKLLVILFIISLVLVTGCNKQAAKKESAVSDNAAPTETAPDTTETAPAQESAQEQTQETTGAIDTGVSDQELAALKSELNEDVVEDVDTTAFQ